MLVTIQVEIAINPLDPAPDSTIFPQNSQITYVAFESKSSNCPLEVKLYIFDLLKIVPDVDKCKQKNMDKSTEKLEQNVFIR